MASTVTDLNNFDLLGICGEDAGRPVDAVGLAAMGLRSLSMRPASIGPVKALLRQVDLEAVRAVIEAGRARGLATVRPMLEEYLRDRGILV